jgi:hypothetical protein
MFEEVPEPVWKTSIGNWSSSSPSRSARRGGDALGLVGVEQPELGVHLRGGALDPPSQRATGTGIGSPETGKLATAFVVSPPQKLLSGLDLAHADRV